VQESGSPLAMFFRSLAPNFNAQVGFVLYCSYDTVIALLISCMCVHYNSEMMDLKAELAKR